MKVCVLGPLYPYRGGIAHYTARLCRALVEAGHEVSAINLSRQYPDFLFPGTSQHDPSAQSFDFPAERIVDSTNPLSWARAVRRLRRERPELLIIQWWHPYFAASFGAIAYGARALGIQVAFVVHNALPHESSPVDRTLTRFALGAATRILVHAHSEQERVRSLVRDKLVVVNPHPVYDQFVTPAESTDGVLTQAGARAELGSDADRLLLFFGLIRPYKGLDVLLAAMPRVVEETGAKLWVAGECYEGRDEYLAMINDLGIEEHVRFEDRYVANEEVPVLMAASDVVVLPYRHATQSGVVQVAYGCRRPVITSAVGGIPEVVWEGETGLLVPPSDPDALASAIRRFYDRNLGEEMQRGIDRHLPSLSWEGLVSRLLGPSGDTH